MTSKTMTKSNRSKKRLLRAGYTVAEVMVAISLFAIGGSGVIAMENAAIRGNAIARRLDQAAIVGNSYIDHMQKSLVTWTSGAPPAAVFPLIDGTTWNPASATTGYDINGLETTNNIVFCVQHQDTSLQVIGGNPSVVRADVIVYWNVNLDSFGNCATAVVPGTAGYHYLYLTTVAKVQTP